MKQRGNERQREKDEAVSAVVTARDIHPHVIHTSLPRTATDFPRGIRLPWWSHYQRSSSTPSRANLPGTVTIKIIIGPDRRPSSCSTSVHVFAACTPATKKIITGLFFGTTSVTPYHFTNYQLWWMKNCYHEKLHVSRFVSVGLIVSFEHFELIANSIENCIFNVWVDAKPYLKICMILMLYLIFSRNLIVWRILNWKEI